MPGMSVRSSPTQESSPSQPSVVAGSGGGGGGTPSSFIRQIVEEDLVTGRHQKVTTRFPPEPNGFLHLGHAKSICLNFGLAREFGGRCHLRFDDTNPEREEGRYIESIQEDVKWLGGDWGSHLYFASDYFQQLYEWAVRLVELGFAYVDEQSEEQVRLGRGDLTTPGTNSPFRDRPIAESLTRFEDMRAGRVPEGGCILRAKIDMSHGNMNLRDPPIYRVKLRPHPRTGDTWKIYPIYDFAHGQCDSIEQITHSICTLEFESHRPLYEWFQEKLDIFRTRQIEFARLNCSYMVMSKRKLLELVEGNHVEDWDDPRLPTISGMRRRGYPAAAIRDFCDRIGVAKRDTLMSIELLERCVSSALHTTSYRRQVVLAPLKVVIISIAPDAPAEELDCPNHPDSPSKGSRKVKFGREIYIDETDFMVDPPANYHRLRKGGEVRLRFAYWIKCVDYETDDSGRIVQVYCTHDIETRGGNAPSDGRKVKGTIHWVAASEAIDIEVRVYDRLFSLPEPEVPREGKSWIDMINPNSLKVYKAAKAEPDLAAAVHPYKGGYPYQFERVGYFVADYSSIKSHPVFNLAVPLTDSWAAKTDAESKEAQNKLAAKLARERAALERQKKKEQRELKKLEKFAVCAKATTDCGEQSLS